MNKRKTVHRHFTKRLTIFSMFPVKNVYNELTYYRYLELRRLHHHLVWCSAWLIYKYLTS